MQVLILLCLRSATTVFGTSHQDAESYWSAQVWSSSLTSCLLLQAYISFPACVGCVEPYRYAFQWRNKRNDSRGECFHSGVGLLTVVNNVNTFTDPSGTMGPEWQLRLGSFIHVAARAMCLHVPELLNSVSH